MRVIKALALLFSLGVAVNPVAAQTAATTATLDVVGMACSACAKTVEKAALTVPGVKAARVNQPTGMAEIEYESSRTSPDEIAKEISKKTGFEAKSRGAKK